MQDFIAWAFPIAVIVGIVIYTLIDWRRNPPLQLPSPEARVDQYDLLMRETAATPGNEPKTAIMLVEQSKISFERVAAERASLETRATTLVGLAAAGTGASAFLAGGRGVALSPAVIEAAGLAVLSLVCLLFILRYKANPQPNMMSFVLDSIVWGEDMQFRICISLAEAYSRGILQLRTDMRKDRIAISAAIWSLGAATALVVLGAIFPPKKVPDLTHCDMTYKGNAIVKVECNQ